MQALKVLVLQPEAHEQHTLRQHQRLQHSSHRCAVVRVPNTGTPGKQRMSTNPQSNSHACRLAPTTSCNDSDTY
jgi:hypothetical protein